MTAASCVQAAQSMADNDAVKVHSCVTQLSYEALPSCCQCYCSSGRGY
jgi:hypothetical protein